MNKLPLEGIRIIDSTTILAAPYSMALLGDMGADVIKVEAHVRRSRGGGILFQNEVAEDWWNECGFFNIPNRSKRSLTIDLKQDEGKEILRRLVAKSDIFVENNRPGVAKRLGIDYESLRAIKDDIIVLSNSGFGQTGPWWQYGGIGRMLEATSGLASLTGLPDEPPQRIGSAYVDLQVAYSILFMLTSALIHREKTGRGQYIDLSMYQIGVSMIGDAVLGYHANGDEGERRGNRDRYCVPQGVYGCQGDDAWLALSVRDDRDWAALATLIGKPELADNPEYADALARRERQDEIDDWIAEWTGEYSADEGMRRLQEAGIPAGKLSSNRDLLFDPQLLHRGFFQSASHREDSRLGEQLYPGQPYRFSETPVSVQGPAPELGEHNREVLADLLGYAPDEVDMLEQIGVIGSRPIGPGEKPQDRNRPLDDQLRTGHVRAVDQAYEERIRGAYPSAASIEQDH